MKKTLILTALLGCMTAQAESVDYFVTGFNADNIQTAYHNQMVGSMCWGANASNVLAWWQDQLVAQGYNLPKDVPGGYEIYGVYQTAFSTSMKGANTPSALNWWITGQRFGSGSQLVDGLGGYYQGLLTQEPGSYYMQENLIGSCGPGDTANLKGFSSEIIDNLTNGRVLLANISGSWNVTIWGVRYDTDTEQISHVYYTDPHDRDTASKIYCSALGETAITGGDSPLPTFYLYNGYTTSNGTIMDMYSLTCNIEEFLTDEAYIDRGDGAFAPHYNVQLDSGKEYSLAEAMTAGGKASANVTITNGTVKVEENGSTEGAVIFSQGEDESATRKLSVQRTGLVLSEVQVNADATLEVTAGNDVTITTTTGTGTLVKTGEGTLKGSGTFGAVTIDGGRLVVGNAPGHQEYNGALTLNSGSLVFCVSGFNEASSGDNVGWTSGTYSTINMNGNELVIGDNGQIVIALSADAANSLTLGSDFTLELVSGMANTLTGEQLAALAAKTSFELTDELATGRSAADPAALIQGVSYTQNGGNLVLRATYGTGDNVPEPATGTLSLLALAGLMARRRRK